MAVPVLIGEAVLNPDTLVDSLVTDVIDGLREELQPGFGVRAYRVYVVRRSWTGRTAGEGTFTDTAGELRPQPLVWVWNGLRFQQAACGLEELGTVKITEVSLTYTESQLRGLPLSKSQECFIAIGEAHGQGSFTRLYTHDQPPYVDRVKDLGWAMFLRKVEAARPWAPS